MKNPGLSVFLPLRSGSQRSVKKNTKPFTPDGRSLFQIKMEQVANIISATEIVISTNDADVIAQAENFKNVDSRVKVIERPDWLCQSTTKVLDLINYVPTVVTQEHILWLHATAPFVSNDDYQAALNEYWKVLETGSHDSLMSVTKVQQFIWSEKTKSIINYDRSINPWPNTQDLDPLYEINHAFYISSKKNYSLFSDRIGKNPSVFPLDGEKKIDIDWEPDFKFAQLIFLALNSDKKK